MFPWIILSVNALFVIFGVAVILGNAMDVNDPSNKDGSSGSFSLALVGVVLIVFPLFGVRWAIDQIDAMDFSIEKYHIYIVAVVALCLSFMGVLKTHLNYLGFKKVKMEQFATDVEVLYERRFGQISGEVILLNAQSHGEERIINNVLESQAKAQAGNVLTEKIAAINEMNIQSLTLVTSGLKFPKLKSNELYLKIMRSIEATEGDLFEAKRRFNQVVGEYNEFLMRFPRCFVMRLFGHVKMPYMKSNAAVSEMNFLKALGDLGKVEPRG